MSRRCGVGLGLLLSLFAAASCARNGDTTSPPSSPQAIDGVLLRASDLPTMRLQFEEPLADAVGMANALGGPEACACPTVFKDDIEVVIEKLEGFGFKRGYTEVWAGAGVHAAAFAAEFDTVDHAKAALDYMSSELSRDCVDEPYCSNKVKIKDSGIPGLVGLALTPLRPKVEGRQAPFYKFLFRVDTAVYGAMDGATDAYDPGSVSQAEALTFVNGFYDRVKSQKIADVLRSAPPTRRGPPHGHGPESEEPESQPTG